MDVLFTRFLASGYANLSIEEQADFQRMLEVQDPTIMDWLFGRYDSEDAGMQAVVEKLKVVSGINN